MSKLHCKSTKYFNISKQTNEIGVQISTPKLNKLKDLFPKLLNLFLLIYVWELSSFKCIAVDDTNKVL